MTNVSSLLLRLLQLLLGSEGGDAGLLPFSNSMLFEEVEEINSVVDNDEFRFEENVLFSKFCVCVVEPLLYNKLPNDGVLETEQPIISGEKASGEGEEQLGELTEFGSGESSDKDELGCVRVI